MKRFISGQNRLVFIFSISFLIILSVLSYSSTNRLIHNLDMVAHTHSVIMRLENIVSLTRDAESMQRGYLLTNDTTYLRKNKEQYTKVMSNYHEAYSMIQNKDQLKKMDSLRIYIDRRFERLNYVTLLQQRNIKTALGKGRVMMNDMRRITDELKDYEKYLLKEFNERADIYEIITPMVSISLSLFAAVIAVFSFINLVRDLQRVKKAEEEAKRSESTLLEAHEIAKIATWELDLHSKKFHWSPQYKKMLGLQADQMNYDDYLFMIPFEESKGFDTLIQEAVENKSAFSWEHRLLTGEGTKWITGNGKAITDEQGNIVKLSGVMQDVSSRKKAEYTLEKVLNSAVSGVIVYKPFRDENQKIVDFICLLMNRAAESFTGYNSETHTGKAMSELFPDNWESGMFDRFVKVAETNESEDFEFYVEAMDKWFQFVIVKLNDGCAVTFTDVTERIKYQTDLKRYQQELELKIQQLKNSNIELERFAYVASHDLQEPLRKITSFGDRLVHKYSKVIDEAGMDYLERMQSASFRMQKMITDLLNLSRISRNKEPFIKIKLSVILEDVINSLEYTIRKKKAKIKYDDLPEIEVIPSQINHLFQNLITNSLKFSKENVPCEIHITSETLVMENLVNYTDGGMEYCRIYFKDNGIGIDEKYHDRIFDIFQRLHGRGEYEGTGIGLSICKKVVDLHRGTLIVESIENEGSLFIVTLPVKQE